MKIKHFVVSTLFLFSSVLLAHSDMKNSSPSAGEVLYESPEIISLTFTKPVKLIKLKLVGSDQEEVKTDFMPSISDHSEYRITPEKMPNGEFTVFWTIMGQDGHKMKGDFKFEVKNTPVDLQHDEHKH